MDLSDVTKALGGLEAKLADFSEKATQEIKLAGSQSVETKNAIEKLGQQQHEFAQRLVSLEQKGIAPAAPSDGAPSWGKQFVESASYKSFVEGSTQKARFEVKNTVTGSDTTVAPDRKPGVVGGAFRQFRVEQALSSLPTDSNAIEFTRENVFTNAAAETAEGTTKPETSITFSLVNVPVQTIAHWIKISKQLAADNAALAAYINTRMRYGVDLRVEGQLINGNGTSPNLSGLLNTGNFTPHGYTAAALTGAGLSATNRLDIIRRVMADCDVADYPCEAVILNPIDWALMELAKDSQGKYLLGDPANRAAPQLWGRPVIATAAIAQDSFLLGAFSMAATVYNRQGVVVEMSEHDTDNFVKNLITIRAERRLALSTERPASLRGGDLTPA